MSGTCALHGRTNFSDLRSRDINDCKHEAKPLNDSKNAVVNDIFFSLWQECWQATLFQAPLWCPSRAHAGSPVSVS